MEKLIPLLLLLPSLVLGAPQIDKLQPSVTNVSVGDTIDYYIKVTLDEGEENNLVIEDELPAGLSLKNGGYFYIITTTNASNGNLSQHYNGAVPSPALSNGAGTGGDITMTFGRTHTTADGNAGNNSFLIWYQAVVDAGATGTLTNIASLTSDAGNATDPTNPSVNAGTNTPSNIAFPTAEGFAAQCVGGRGGSVIKVTNLNGQGAGSLKAAVDASGPRIVVFDVSGVIPCPTGDSELVIPNGDITIAGQTAPGGGITLNCRLSGQYSFGVDNFVVRHMRIRPELHDPADPDHPPANQYDAVQFSRNDCVMLDHLSIAGGADENMDFFEADDTTLQWSVLEKADNSAAHPDGSNHNYGAISGPAATNVSYLNNYVANLRRRAPAAVSRGPVEVHNNLVYNTQVSLIHNNTANLVFWWQGNYFKDGPSQSLVPVNLDAEPGSGTGLSYWVIDNWVEDASTGNNNALDIWDNGVSHPTTALSQLCQFFNAPNTCDTYQAASAPSFSGPFYEAPVITPVAQTPSKILGSASVQGAGAYPRDQMTKDSIADYNNGTGVSDYFPLVNWMQGLTPSAPPTDTDNDGIPDAWETANGLNPSDASDNQTLMADGYPAIESYINQLADSLL